MKREPNAMDKTHTIYITLKFRTSLKIILRHLRILWRCFIAVHFSVCTVRSLRMNICVSMRLCACACVCVCVCFGRIAIPVSVVFPFYISPIGLHSVSIQPEHRRMMGDFWVPTKNFNRMFLLFLLSSTLFIE